MADTSVDLWGRPWRIDGHTTSSKGLNIRNAGTAQAATNAISGYRATINSQILACIPEGDLALATEWYQRMAKSGLQPDDITIAAMTRVSAKAQNTVACEWWMHAMLTNSATFCNLSFAMLIDCFTESGRLDKVEHWFRHVTDMGVQLDATPYNALISAAATFGIITQAEQWFKQMVTEGATPNLMIFNSLIIACATSGEVGRAAHWCREMKLAGYRGNEITYGALISACSQAGHAFQAGQWLDEMVCIGVTPNLTCFNTVLHAYACQGHAKGVQRWFEKMLAVGIYPDKTTFDIMIEAFVQAGETKAAENLLQHMVNCGINVDRETLCALLPLDSNCLTDGKLSGPMHDAYAAIIRAYAAAGNIEALKEWACKEEAAGLWFSGVLATWVAHLANAHDPAFHEQVPTALAAQQQGQQKPKQQKQQQAPFGNRSMQTRGGRSEGRGAAQPLWPSGTWECSDSVVSLATISV